MNKGLHVGCLCVIVGGSYPENLGRVVEVVTHNPNSLLGLFWEAESVDGGLLHCQQHWVDTVGTRIWFKGPELLPITPDESITQETDREVVV